MKALLPIWTKPDGKTIEVMLNAPLQDPVKYKLMGYEVSLRRQEAEVRKFAREEQMLLPKDIDYLALDNLRLEARQKLDKARPVSLGQASRVPGVSPGDISVLMILLEKLRREGKAE